MHLNSTYKSDEQVASNLEKGLLSDLLSFGEPQTASNLFERPFCKDASFLEKLASLKRSVWIPLELEHFSRAGFSRKKFSCVNHLKHQLEIKCNTQKIECYNTANKELMHL